MVSRCVRIKLVLELLLVHKRWKDLLQSDLASLALTVGQAVSIPELREALCPCGQAEHTQRPPPRYKQRFFFDFTMPKAVNWNLILSSFCAASCKSTTGQRQSSSAAPMQ